MNAIKDRAILAADLLDRGIARLDSLFIDFYNFSADVSRITIISHDGTVLLDNKADAASMGNHSDREEFIQAVQTGSGEAIRFSQTLRTETYYYAVLLDDGSVLRVSKNMSSINAILSVIIPAIIAITLFTLLIAAIIARRLTKIILEPLNWIDFTGENIVAYDELVPYQKKIDQQKREIAEQIAALKYRADTIEVITGSMREGLILIDMTGIVLIANNSAAEVYHEDTLEKKNILHVCRNIEFRHGVKQCLSGENAEIECQLNGRIYNIYFYPVQEENRINGGVILFFDVTEKNKAEKQRREFSANVSHELKTPLTSITALSEMIENGMAKEEDISGFAVKISEQAKRLSDIINDIIKISEFDEKKAEVGSEVFELYTLAETVADSLRENDKGVLISIEGESFKISANYRMIDELLYNLIDNGIKYNRDGGHVTVKLMRENGVCRITVSDTGIGIPKEHHSRVFERFYRVDKSRSKKTGGTGLGLSIVKHITEHHGGRVEVESIDGVGTTVVCWLEAGV